MGTYRKKPVEVEAVQFDGTNVAQMQKFCGYRHSPDMLWEMSNFNWAGTFLVTDDDRIVGEVWDKLHSSWVGVKRGDWIIRGLEGEYYPCDDEVFRKSYTEVGTPSYSEHHDGETLYRVFDALKSSGLTHQATTDAIRSLQNNGILFREVIQNHA